MPRERKPVSQEFINERRELKEAFKDKLQEDLIKKIQRAVRFFKHYELISFGTKELFSDDRTRKITEVRQLLMHFFKGRGYTYKDLSEVFNREPSVVLYSVRAMEKKIDYDVFLVKLYNILYKNLR